ncbi:MAG: hypothetical protein M1826_007487 [Phylliscum demangeonii]|nr:MAG: hypothetical protein M1826_007487 [Phylliscum demangeonii]
MHSPSLYRVVLAISLTAFLPAISALPQHPPPPSDRQAPPPPPPPSQPYRKEVAAGAGVASLAGLAALVLTGPNTCLKAKLEQRTELDDFRTGVADPWGAHAPVLSMTELRGLEALDTVEEIVHNCEQHFRMKIDMNRNANMRLLYQGYRECTEELCNPLLKHDVTIPANGCRDFCVDRWRLPHVFEPGRLATGDKADVRVNVRHRNRMPFHVEEVVRGVQRGVHKLESEVSRGAKRLAVPLYRNSPAFLKKEEAALFAHGR